MHYRIYLFSNESCEREFVVISDLEPTTVIAEHATGDITHRDTVGIDGYAGAFPCSRELRRVL